MSARASTTSSSSATTPAFPKERIKVFLYEDLKDQEAFFAELFAFLGVDPGFRPDTSVRHRKASLPKSYALQHLVKQPGLAKAAVKQLVPAGARLRAKEWLASWNATAPERLDPDIRRDALRASLRRRLPPPRAADRKEPRAMVSLEAERTDLDAA